MCLHLHKRGGQGFTLSDVLQALSTFLVIFFESGYLTSLGLTEWAGRSGAFYLFLPPQLQPPHSAFGSSSLRRKHLANGAISCFPEEPVAKYLPASHWMTPPLLVRRWWAVEREDPGDQVLPWLCSPRLKQKTAEAEHIEMAVGD